MELYLKIARRRTTFLPEAKIVKLFYVIALRTMRRYITYRNVEFPELELLRSRRKKKFNRINKI